MARRITGSLYQSRGVWFLSLTFDKRVHVRLGTCTTEAQAELRRQIIVDIAERLRGTGKIDIAIAACRQAGEATDDLLPGILRLVDGLIAGTERVAKVVPVPAEALSMAAPSVMTFMEFGNLWTSNELNRRFRGHVKHIDQDENIRRLKTHVYPIIFRTRTIGDTTLSEFGLDHADHVLAQPTLPDGSLRHVAQCMHRIMKLAVYPARLLDRSPFPPGWLPAANEQKERGYLYPLEDADLMGYGPLALVWRLFFGFSNREGIRQENAATIEWANLSLDLQGGGGHIVLDKTKNGRGGTWALDPGTAEAFRRWRTICPSTRWVFPTEAIPGHRRRRAGKSLYVDHASETLREALQSAGVDRPKLYQNGNNRLRIRAHDLRATFVTLALANGKSEDWVMQRTGHNSSIMLARYRREAKTAQELGLGWLQPLHEVIPELRNLTAEPAGSEVQTSANRRQP